MSSTFAELFSDFQDQAKVYTEKFDLTELSFMRLLTRGMQEFQRETHYVEKTVQINRGVAPNAPIFIVPDDMLVAIDVRALRDTPCGIEEELFLNQSYTQLIRNKDKWAGGYLETPTDYAMRMPYKRTVTSGKGPQTRMYSIWQRELITYPEYEGDTLVMWYIPDVHAISAGSTQWAPWFPIDTNFFPNFISRQVTDPLAPFEDTFVNYALSKFVMSQGSANYKVYEQAYKAAVARAIETKPTYYREGVGSYMFAPWS